MHVQTQRTTSDPPAQAEFACLPPCHTLRNHNEGLQDTTLC